MRERMWYAERLRVAIVFAMPAFAGGCAEPAPQDTGAAAAAAESAARATAVLRDAQGREAGTATLTAASGGGVMIEVHVTGLTSGRRGVHIHAAGVCDGASLPVFSSAGDHFNPDDRQHGLENPAGPHAGDMPNIEAGEGGMGHLSFTNTNVTLGAGATSLFDEDGSAVVLHAGPDDQVTDPSGNSGDRIACGVIERA